MEFGVRVPERIESVVCAPVEDEGGDGGGRHDGGHQDLREALTIWHVRNTPGGADYSKRDARKATA